MRSAPASRSPGIPKRARSRPAGSWPATRRLCAARARHADLRARARRTTCHVPSPVVAQLARRRPRTCAPAPRRRPRSAARRAARRARARAARRRRRPRRPRAAGRRRARRRRSRSARRAAPRRPRRASRRRSSARGSRRARRRRARTATPARRPTSRTARRRARGRSGVAAVPHGPELGRADDDDEVGGVERLARAARARAAPSVRAARICAARCARRRAAPRVARAACAATSCRSRQRVHGRRAVRGPATAASSSCRRRAAAARSRSSAASGATAPWRSSMSARPPLRSSSNGACGRRARATAGEHASTLSSQPISCARERPHAEPLLDERGDRVGLAHEPGPAHPADPRRDDPHARSPRRALAVPAREQHLERGLRLAVGAVAAEAAVVRRQRQQHGGRGRAVGHARRDRRDEPLDAEQLQPQRELRAGAGVAELAGGRRARRTARRSSGAAGRCAGRARPGAPVSGCASQAASASTSANDARFAGSTCSSAPGPADVRYSSR